MKMSGGLVRPRVGHSLFLAGTGAVLLALAGCGTAPQDVAQDGAAEPDALSGPVRGTVAGRPFEVGTVDRTGPGMFTLKEADGTANDVLLFFFFFPEEGEDLEGKSFTRSVDDGQFSAPHVHVHFRDEQGDRQVEVMMGGFDLEAHFGEPVGDILPSTMRFAVPKIDVSLEGTFDLPVLQR